MSGSRHRKSLAAAFAALTLAACISAADIGTGVAVGEERLKFAAERRLPVSIFSYCGTPYSTLIRKAAEGRALAEAAKSLCGEL